MKTQFTPGPWHFERELNGSYTVDSGVSAGDGIRIAYVAPQAGAIVEVTYASLIAAAPDLLAALQGLMAIQDSVTQGQERELRAEWVPKARAAIAKATQS